ncbi:unnamed protein product [Amoebophrya sp. A120]|nr:unnamed protein product [Amoebophrya sp. A120]|eukprot:GSA120T00024078001.1
MLFPRRIPQLLERCQRAGGNQNYSAIFRRGLQTGSEQIGGSVSSSADPSASRFRLIKRGAFGVTSASVLALGGTVFYEVYARQKYSSDVDEVAEVLQPVVLRTNSSRRNQVPVGGAISGSTTKDTTPGQKSEGATSDVDDTGQKNKAPSSKRRENKTGTSGAASDSSTASAATVQPAAPPTEDADISTGFLDRRVKHLNFFELCQRIWTLGRIFLPVVALWVPWWYLAPCQVEYIQDPQERKLLYDKETGKVEILDTPTTTSVARSEAPTAEEVAQLAKPRLKDPKSRLSESDLQRNQERRLQWCKRLRAALEQAGPVFIKWGQWASTRYDLFPVELCDELNRLTQNSPAHTMAETEEILKRNFGNNVLEYLQLEPEPVASGSIGQVYRAQVRVGEYRSKQVQAGLENAGFKGAGGTESVVLGETKHQLATTTEKTSGAPVVDRNYVVNVAVKVQHPRLERVMDLDFAILEKLSRFTDTVCNWYFESSYRLNRMLKQFRAHMGDQLDFDLEAANLRQFRSNFEGWGNVSFPKASVSTPEVLIESFEPGASISQFIKLKQQDRDREKRRKELLEKGVDENFVADRLAIHGLEGEKKDAGNKGSSSSSNPSSKNKSSSSTSSPATISASDRSNSSSSDVEYSADQLHGELVERLGTIGLMALLKMIIVDNFIHADLHPGNVFVRHYEQKGGFLTKMRQNLQSWILGLGTDVTQLPDVCFLDAGLSAHIEPSLGQNVRGFFQAMLEYDGKKLAEEILALSAANLGSLNASNRASFIEELSAKGHIWRRIRQDPALYKTSRSRDIIKDVLDCCRRHTLELHPTILVAVVSTITLEGWQYELDPSINIMHHVDLTLRQHATWGNRIAFLDGALRDLLRFGTKATSFLM